MRQLTTIERNGGNGMKKDEFFNVAAFKTKGFVQIERTDDYSIRVNETRGTAVIKHKDNCIATVANPNLAELIVSAYEVIDSHADLIVREIDLHLIEQ